MTMQLKKITVFGATGGVGRLVVAQAVAAGYGVTAAVRNPAGLPAGVHVVTVDLAGADPAAVDRAVDGADAVWCCIGARSKAETGIPETGVSAIVRAMSASGSRRFVAISAGPVSTVASPARPDPPPDPGNRFLMRRVAMPTAQRVFRRQYADLARMEVPPEDIGDSLPALVLEDSFRLRRQLAPPHNPEIGAQPFYWTAGHHLQLCLDGSGRCLGTGQKETGYMRTGCG